MRRFTQRMRETMVTSMLHRQFRLERLIGSVILACLLTLFAAGTLIACSFQEGAHECCRRAAAKHPCQTPEEKVKICPMDLAETKLVPARIDLPPQTVAIEASEPELISPVSDIWAPQSDDPVKTRCLYLVTCVFRV